MRQSLRAFVMPTSTELRPRVGCGAFIQRADGRLLLVLRGRAPEQGHWGLPGGKVDWMETVEATVVREVLEETGLQVHPQRVLCVVSHFEPDMDPPQHWVAPVYLASIDGSEQAQLCEPQVLLDIGWFALDALPTPLTRSAVQAVRQVRAEQAAPVD
ncbi:NUDIX domain-containing protein [Xanthomonas cannabis]|uniref:DNA mismatch repair protein MutT n=1 Tax=Xanthomonas cannabis pv. phaseoli TaxID=1885902 RepID=A0AB34PFC0_9XANT|nr:NUDIX domain-containing protein [Xanthomonas cannabis]KGK59408.1 DNA mismatch repair protein MutT [Xanthomonas cannabis pv. phaseoli]MCC4608628.1 NUDIX domain-containing protein [Xanthomonas campestris pv. zinniae]